LIDDRRRLTAEGEQAKDPRAGIWSGQLELDLELPKAL
jgi:hypothetical protein